MQKSGKNLDLAADDLRTYDNDTSADLQKVAGQLGADSNPYEPW